MSRNRIVRFVRTLPIHALESSLPKASFPTNATQKSFTFSIASKLTNNCFPKRTKRSDFQSNNAKFSKSSDKKEHREQQSASSVDEERDLSAENEIVNEILDEDDVFKEMRKKAESEQREAIERFSSPLFAYAKVDISEDDLKRKFTMRENAIFCVAVVVVFGYFGHFAHKAETKKRAEAAAAKLRRERRATRAFEVNALKGNADWAIDGYGLDDAGDDDDDDPFDGLTPSEISELSEKYSSSR